MAVIWIKWQNAKSKNQPYTKWWVFQLLRNGYTAQTMIYTLFNFYFPFRLHFDALSMYNFDFTKTIQFFSHSVAFHSFAEHTHFHPSIHPFIQAVIHLPISSSSLQRTPPASTVWSAPWFSISGIQIRWRKKNSVFRSLWKNLHIFFPYRINLSVYAAAFRTHRMELPLAIHIHLFQNTVCKFFWYFHLLFLFVVLFFGKFIYILCICNRKRMQKSFTGTHICSWQT